MDERITIIDDCLNEAHFASRNFDSEGVACETLKFVEKGVLKDYAYKPTLVVDSIKDVKVPLKWWK